MSKIAFILVVTSLVSSGRSQTWTGPNQLHPVQGLYVKPSSDGTTGDLYVAATEDSGTKAQWLTDQPVNFLPAAASSPVANQAIPLAYPTYPAHDESSSNTQKRAVIANPVPQMQYAYALPFNPTEGAQLPYPYAVPTSSSTPETSSPQCEKTAATVIPYNPFQFFYPHMMQASMQAYANAKNVLKESGFSDEKAKVIPQASPFWSNSYSYPPYPMYMMVDPSAWAQSQPAQTTSKAETAESSSK